MRDGERYPVWLARGLLILAVVVVLLVGNAAASDICGYPAKGTLVVTRKALPVGSFRVGLAEKDEQYRRGLMSCRDLAPGTGLLFVYPDARPRTFWMKDTPLPLAIVFVAASGRIAAIEAGQPFSTRHIRSPDNIQYVLEIHPDEGSVLQVGDRITLQLSPD